MRRASRGRIRAVMTAPLRRHISTLVLESITGSKDLLDWAILVENQTENLCFVPSHLLLSLIYFGVTAMGGAVQGF